MKTNLKKKKLLPRRVILYVLLGHISERIPLHKNCDKYPVLFLKVNSNIFKSINFHFFFQYFVKISYKQHVSYWFCKLLLNSINKY